jgi:hypothetical protein
MLRHWEGGERRYVESVTFVIYWNELTCRIPSDATSRPADAVYSLM